MSGKLLYTIDEARRALGCGRTVLYELLNRGELNSVRINSRRMVTAESLVRLAERGTRPPAEERPGAAQAGAAE